MTFFILVSYFFTFSTQQEREVEGYAIQLFSCFTVLPVLGWLLAAWTFEGDTLVLFMLTAGRNIRQSTCLQEIRKNSHWHIVLIMFLR